jgi:glycosyltransferase involved in cell wall biosynthesis
MKAEIFELDSSYSTTKCARKVPAEIVAAEIKVANKREDKFETVLFLPEGEGRQGEGGLRTQGYFKKSEEDKPLITVVTVVYNGEQFLEETILSVINQTYDNVEYIIIDGGSTDGTLDIIRKYEHAIDYWVSENDKGIYEAMNKGIDLASGNWINFMNGGDNFYTSTVLNRVFNKKTHDKVQIIYGDHQIVYPSGRMRFAKAGKVENLWRGSQFCHQASFIKTGYHKSQKFNLCTKIVADFEFFYKAWKSNIKFECLNLVVAKFEAGGVSDVHRIDSIVGRWVFIDKSLKNNFFYCFQVVKESLKTQFKLLFKR